MTDNNASLTPGRDTPRDMLFEGDCGHLALEIRQVLVALMRGPYLWKHKHTALWETLVRYQETIRPTLSNLFLELVIDEEIGMAYLRQADTGDVAAPSLFSTYRLTFLDSVVLVQMRKLLQQFSQRSERAVITDEQIDEILRLYEPATRNNEAYLKKRRVPMLKRFRDHHLLLALAEEGTYEISPVLKVILSAESLAELTELYKRKLASREKAMNIEEQAGIDSEEEL